MRLRLFLLISTREIIPRKLAYLYSYINKFESLLINYIYSYLNYVNIYQKACSSQDEKIGLIMVLSALVLQITFLDGYVFVENWTISTESPSSITLIKGIQSKVPLLHYVLSAVWDDHLSFSIFLKLFLLDNAANITNW